MKRSIKNSRRILLWTDGFWPRLGGIETHGLQLIKELHKRGHECRVLASKDHPDWKEEEIYEGIPIQRFDFNAVIAKKELRLMRKIQEHLEWVQKTFQPDIVHLNATLGGSAFAFLLSMKTISVPIIVTLHDPYMQNPWVVKIVSSAARIACVSNWVLQEMERHSSSLKGKLRVIHNGLPMPAAAPMPLPFSPPTLLLFGRLVLGKGFKCALLAFSLLKKRGSDARLIIAGDGPERPALEKLASELALTVHFTGTLTPEGVFQTINEATLVIVPSTQEPFGLVTLEAMQMQRPVIASRVGGIPEVLGDTGLLVAPGDPRALCEAMQTLLGFPERAVEMGMRGYERAMQFSIGRNVDQFECLYEEVL